MIAATLGIADLKARRRRARDRLGLAALLRADAGIGACRVDQRDDRDVEAVRHAHQPRRLAVALGPRHAEIVLQPAVGVGALFMADDTDAVAAEAAEPSDDRGVLAVLAIAGEGDEIGDQRCDVIEAMRPLRMPRDLRLLPGRQSAVEFLERLGCLAFDAVDLFADRDRIALGLQRAQFLDLGLELGHRFFEIEIRAHYVDNLHQKDERLAPHARQNRARGAPKSSNAPAKIGGTHHLSRLPNGGVPPRPPLSAVPARA